MPRRASASFTGTDVSPMPDEEEIRELVATHGAAVNAGRPVKQLIEDGELPRLSGCTVLEGKVVRLRVRRRLEDLVGEADSLDVPKQSNLHPRCESGGDPLQGSGPGV